MSAEHVFVFLMTFCASLALFYAFLRTFIRNLLSNTTYYQELTKTRRIFAAQIKLSVLYKAPSSVSAARDEIENIKKLIHENLGQNYTFEIICLTHVSQLESMTRLRAKNIDIVPYNVGGLKRLILGFIASKGEMVVDARYLPLLIDRLKVETRSVFFVFSEPTEFNESAKILSKPILFSKTAGLHVLARVHCFCGAFTGELLRLCRAMHVDIEFKRFPNIKRNLSSLDLIMARVIDKIALQFYSMGIWTVGRK